MPASRGWLVLGAFGLVVAITAVFVVRPSTRELFIGVQPVVARILECAIAAGCWLVVVVLSLVAWHRSRGRRG